MQITLRTLQQQNFLIDIDPELTVQELKEKIENVRGQDYPVAGQKLIYAGKILEDKTKIAECHIEEGKFVVVMVTKAKPTTAAPPAPAVVTPASAPTPTPVVPPTANITAPTTTGTPGSDSLLLSGSAFEDAVNSIMGMAGHWERPMVEQALRASFNNPDRAVEYLISGIPDELIQDDAAGAGGPPAGTGGGGGVEAGSGVTDSASNSLAFLRSQPQFEHMRTVVRENPQLLNAVLQQIGQSNPALLQIITENQEEFVRLLNEDVGGVPTGGGPVGGPTPGGGFQIQITSADKEAIERLKGLGFPEHMVIQAYFACEKDENMAANFLIQNGFEDD